MKKILLATLICAASLQTAFAAKDVTTNPDAYFLKESQVVDSLKLLPPPPAMDSIDFLNDKAQYDVGKMLKKYPARQAGVERCPRCG